MSLRLRLERPFTRHLSPFHVAICFFLSASEKVTKATKNEGNIYGLLGCIKRNIKCVSSISFLLERKSMFLLLGSLRRTKINRSSTSQCRWVRLLLRTENSHRKWSDLGELHSSPQRMIAETKHPIKAFCLLRQLTLLANSASDVEQAKRGITVVYFSRKGLEHDMT